MGSIALSSHLSSSTMMAPSKRRGPADSPPIPSPSSSSSSSPPSSISANQSHSNPPIAERSSNFLSVTSYLPHQTSVFLQRYRIEVAAGSSSILSTLAAFPLDSVKTRMQTYHYSGVADCVRNTYRAEKLGGFFRGVTAPLFSVAVVRTISFSVYQRAKLAYAGLLQQATGLDVLRQVKEPGSVPTIHSLAWFAASGATAGAVVSVAACPFEFTKVSAQVSVLIAETQRKAAAAQAATASTPAAKKAAAVSASVTNFQNKGTLRTMAAIVQSRGARGLYTGFRLHMLRDTLGTGIYFMVYESCKQLGATLGNSNLAIAASGGLCGMVSGAIVYPIDSVKSIYQRNALLYDPTKRTVEANGTTSTSTQSSPRVRFFQRQNYRGLGVSMGRSCLVNAIFFSAFEFLKKHIHNLEVADL